MLTGVKTVQVLGDGSKVTGIRFLELSTQTESNLEIDGVFVQIGLLPNTTFVKDLVTLTPSGEIVVDSKGRTSTPGIYAAGDVTTLPFKQIVMAMGDGAKVALTVFEDRLHEKTVSSGTRFANEPQSEGEKNTL